MEGKEPPESKRLSHQRWPTTAAALFLSAFITACGAQASDQSPPLPLSSDSPEPGQPTAEATPFLNWQMLRENLAQGRMLKEAETIDLETQPGIDLKYEKSQQVAKIRAIANPQKRILQAIGYLDVMASKRYSPERGWNCNIYAIDLLRLLVGHQDIGSLYFKDGGTPAAYDPQNPPQEDFSFLSSNNLDQWLQEYGQHYGWQLVTTQAELKERLRGDYIALAVTPLADLKTQGGNTAIGHSLIVFRLDDSLLISQGTRNILAQPMPLDHPKVNPENQGGTRYHFWVHQLAN